MERDMQKSPPLDYPFSEGDAKYVSRLSTILVANIQETKDRISQIESIFCSQLFPNFQSKSKSLQKIYSDAREAAEDTWKNKVSDLLLQIEKLQLENKVVLEENQSLKLEKAQLVSNKVALVEPVETTSYFVENETKMKELKEENSMLMQKQGILELEVQESRRGLVEKSKEVEEGMEMQSRLHQLVQSKASLIQEKEKKLKEKEEKENELSLQIKFLEKSLRMTKDQLYRKSDELMKEQDLSVNNKQLLVDSVKEKQLLKSKVEMLEGKLIELHNEMRNKNEEVEEGKKLEEKYLGQIDTNSKELLKAEKENILLEAKRKGLEDRVNKLEAILRERANETSEGLELHGKLLKQIEDKDSELQSEKKKRRDVITIYKNLKSQYNFLLMKFGLTAESLNRPNEVTNESNFSRHGLHNQNPSTSADKGIRPPIERIKCELPSPSNSHAAPIEPVHTKSGSLAGTKRPVSSWRETRSHQKQGGLDPHDNFLDTPLQNIKGNVIKSSKDEEVHDIPDAASRDINLDSSDDETQDLSAKKPAPESGVKNGFKYVGPVRKRAERENLQGLECKQCRKFYDAVLPQGEGDRDTLRCEHHDGVSRHRYRYAPPSTPEGFWNIGFDTDM